jgi:hypothetical protein
MNNSQPSNTSISRFAGLVDRDAYHYDKDAPYPEEIIRERQAEYNEERPVKEEYPDQK